MWYSAGFRVAEAFHFFVNYIPTVPRRLRRRRRKQTHNNGSSFLTCTNRIIISESWELRNAQTYAIPVSAHVCADFCPHVVLITVISHRGSRDVHKRKHFIFGIHENDVAVSRLLQLNYGSAPINSYIDLMSTRMRPQNMCAEFRLLRYNVNCWWELTKRMRMLQANIKRPKNGGIVSG